MARPSKEFQDNCPSLIFQNKPQRKTIINAESKDFEKRYNALRNIASVYIKNRKVRDFFLTPQTVCDVCGSKDNLSIDHIVDVYTFAKSDLNYNCLNCLRNLRVLCSKCNSKKKTIGYLFCDNGMLCKHFEKEKNHKDAEQNY